MSHEGYHEPVERLRERTLDDHRALVSLQEELEAVDWYQQRVDATDDPELAAILAHNRDEEKEHAAMTLEWLRRRDPILDQQLRTYLFVEGSILDAEADTMGRGDPGEPDPAVAADDDAPAWSDPVTDDGSLGLGSLRGLSNL